MERLVEKALEKVQKLKAKQQYQKARTILEELPVSSRATLEVAHCAIGISLHLDKWQDLIVVLRHALIAHEFVDLLGGDNREVFTRVVLEQPAFSRALLDMVGHFKHLRAVAGWFELSDIADQRFLIESWTRVSDEATDKTRESLLKVCAGVGLMLTHDEEGAFRLWARALHADPRQLKKIMTFCQGLGGDPKELHNRLRLIKLVAAAGKLTECLTLLKALGTENEINALKVLNEMPDILPGQLKNKDVLALRFSLALRLDDQEIIAAVVNDLDELNEDDLFPFKKQALHQMTDAAKRQLVLLHFVRLYIRQENWENAAPLLQSMYEENPSGEVVALMEQVLDRFPIISSLRYILGKHMLNKGDVVSGMQHLSTIAQVSEFEGQIRRLLEDRLQVQYDSEVARLLVRLLPMASNEAGLVACLMAINDPRSFLSALPEWGEPHLREQLNPFWALALIRANLSVKRFEPGYSFLIQFLRRFPDLSPELVSSAEVLCNHHIRDYSDLVRIIDSLADRMEPKRAWGALRKRFIVATKTGRSTAPEKAAEAEGAAAVMVVRAAAPAASAAPPTAAAVPPAEPSGVPPEFHQFRALLEAHNYRAAALVAEKTVAAYPQSILFVLNQLERLCREQFREILWPVTMLRILITSAAFDKATEVGRKILANHHFHAEMPQIYQLLARAYEGMGNLAEALRFYCLSSRQARFYEQNRGRLVEMVFPNLHQFAEEVVQLILNNQDQDNWEELTRQWYKARPEDLDRIIVAQKAFCEQMGSPRARLDLAFWYLQAGRLHDIDDTLNMIDLHDPEILEYLTHIAHLAHLKYPEDPKAKFLLGKYYLVQKDISKAVDTFRNLASQIPDAAETIYHFLRTYLKKSAANTDLVTLYGLLIRFALDHGSPVSAVRLLDELGLQDKAGASDLVNGVYRVVLRKEGRLEAMYELMALLYSWESFELFLDVAEQGGFVDHMAAERLEWLHVVSNEGELHDRAMLSIAQVYFDIFDFTRCREALRRIEHGSFRRKALPLFERLTERFPDQMDVWREAGWAAYPQEPEKALHFFRKLYTCTHFENRLEAYALLRELGDKPHFDDLTELVEDVNKIYSRLFALHRHLRDMELAYWESSNQNLSVSSLEWLVANGRFDRFRENLASHNDLADMDCALLESYSLMNQGCLSQAAWHLVPHPVPVELAQSLLCGANMVERAVLIKKPGTRLPIFIRDAFLERQGKPALITTTVEHIRRCQRTQMQSLSQITVEVPHG